MAARSWRQVDVVPDPEGPSPGGSSELVNDHQNDDLSKRRGCATSATPHPRRKARRASLPKDKRAGEGRFVRRSRDTSRQPERSRVFRRTLPCQQDAGNRCATRRSPRWCPTVDAEGKRSLGVQLNVLFRHFDSAAAPRVAPPPALTSHCMRAFTCIHASPSTPMTHLAACPVQAASSRTSCRASSTRRACRRWRARSGSLPEPATRPRACHSLVLRRVSAVARRPTVRGRCGCPARGPRWRAVGRPGRGRAAAFRPSWRRR